MNFYGFTLYQFITYNLQLCGTTVRSNQSAADKPVLISHHVFWNTQFSRKLVVLDLIRYIINVKILIKGIIILKNIHWYFACS